MRVGALVGAALVAVSLTGCSWRGLNSLPLPGTEGNGDGSYEVTIQMPDVSTIERNSRVLVDDVTVGRVSDIALQNGRAIVTVRLNGDVALPANATAAVGQTSLLGSTHVELAPPTDVPAAGRLTGGAVIPLDRAGAYPTTEETLSSLSLVLNGGGLAQIGEITAQVNDALGGRTDSVRDLLARVNTLLDGLDTQKNDIVVAIDNLDRFSADVAAQNQQLGTAVDTLAPALGVLSDRRQQLTTTLTTLGTLGTTAEAIVDDTRGDLVAELEQLQPVLKSLADSGTSLTESFRYLLTYPFPIDTYQNAVRGDYANGDVTLDLRLATLDNALFLGTPFEGALTGGVAGASGPQITVPYLGDLVLAPPGGTP